MKLTWGLRVTDRMGARRERIAVAFAIPVAALLAFGCGSSVDPKTYRLADSGAVWERSGSDEILADLRPRYAAFFATIYDRVSLHNMDLLSLRDDLERSPVTRANFDALNAVAVCYFELNYQAESDRGGPNYLADSHRAAKLLAVPWRAYSEVEDAGLRDAILDFFDDIAHGNKQLAMRTAPRVKDTVAALARKEADPARLARINEMVDRLDAMEAARR